MKIIHTLLVLLQTESSVQQGQKGVRVVSALLATYETIINEYAHYQI